MNEGTVRILELLAVIFVQGLIAAVSYGKTSAIVTTEIGGMKDRQGRHEEQTDSRFADVAKEQDQQWHKIGEHGESIAFLKAKVNGKAAGVN